MQFSEFEAFDKNISVDISLSKILDAFIFESESPKTIIAFLEQHDSLFKEIISHSLCWTRLFQIDFVLQCEDEQVDYLISKLKSIPGKIAAYCSWQICCSNSFTSQKLKWKFRKELSWILDHFKTRHPYHNFTGKDISRIDAMLFAACNKQEFPEILNDISIEDFSSLVTLSDSSLFKFRIYSLDVFQELNDARKWIFLTVGHYWDDQIMENFAWQLLNSDEDKETKIVLLDKLDSYCRLDDICHPYYRYAECKDFSEMWLKMTIDGSFNALEMLKLLIVKKNWKMLFQWAEKDPESMDHELKISDVIKWKWTKNKSIKKRKQFK